LPQIDAGPAPINNVRQIDLINAMVMAQSLKSRHEAGSSFRNVVGSNPALHPISERPPICGGGFCFLFTLEFPADLIGDNR
jgi:hypothetical protein